MRRVGYWACLIGLAAIVGGAFAYKPWSAYLEQRRLTAEQQQEMASAESKIAKNELERARFESRAGKEEAARKQGFIKVGEKTLEPSD